MSNRDDTYNTRNVLALCIIGVIIKLLFGNNYTEDGSNGPASSALWGYGLSSMAIFFLMFVQLHRDIKKKPSSPDSKTKALQGMFSIIVNILPILLMFIVLSWLVLLNYQYYTQINTGKVASEYKQFSNMSTVMVLLQMAIMFKYIYTLINSKKESPQKTEIEASKYSSVSYLMALLNMVFIGMMNIIILYFSTDG